MSNKKNLINNIIIEGKNITFSYEKKVIFNNVNFKINKNEFLSIIGPNGGGKSTLVKLILGLLKPQIGNIEYNDDVKNSIGYISQNTNINLDFPISVREVIEMGLLKKSLIGFKMNKNLKLKVESIMKKFDLISSADEKISNLSGGQRQKTLIARAMISDPKILVLDEPTSNIDLKSQNEIYNMLKKLSILHSIIVISHDITTTLEYSSRILHVNRAIVEHDAPKVNIRRDSGHLCEIDILEEFINKGVLNE